VRVKPGAEVCEAPDKDGKMRAVAENDRVLIIDRKLFKDDNLRIYIGTVESSDSNVVRIRGYLFHVSPYDVAGTERRGEERTRITSLASGDLIFILPAHINPAEMVLKRSPKSMQLSDGVNNVDLTDFLSRA